MDKEIRFLKLDSSSPALSLFVFIFGLLLLIGSVVSALYLFAMVIPVFIGSVLMAFTNVDSNSILQFGKTLLVFAGFSSMIWLLFRFGFKLMKWSVS